MPRKGGHSRFSSDGGFGTDRRHHLPAVQAGGDDFYVVLFHKAARVEALNVPEGTAISASTGYWTEDGWVEDYEGLRKLRRYTRGFIRTSKSREAWTSLQLRKQCLLTRGTSIGAELVFVSCPKA
jgi:hypothetical protein